MIEKIEMSDLEFRMLRDFIYAKFGIYLKDEKRFFIQMKLSSRVLSLQMNSFNEYLSSIKYGDDRTGTELKYLISALTNNETYFFREKAQLSIFQEHLLPELRSSKLKGNRKNLRILSAGCSSGEEVYTLAILTQQSGMFPWGWDLEFIGVDVSDKALNLARRGVYYSRSFRMTTEEIKNKCFIPDKQGYAIKDSLKEGVSFVSGNILDGHELESLGRVDIIFCRNVFIYFTDDTIKKAVGNLFRILEEGGYLLLGHSETLTGIDVDVPFETKRFTQGFIYRKKVM